MLDTADFDGELVMRYVADTRAVEIVRADPRIRISHEVLHRTLEQVPCHASFDGHLLKVNADNGRAIYRIVGEDVPRMEYLAEWPD